MHNDIVSIYYSAHLPNHQASSYQGYFYFFILLPGIWLYNLLPHPL